MQSKQLPKYFLFSHKESQVDTSQNNEDAYRLAFPLHDDRRITAL